MINSVNALVDEWDLGGVKNQINSTLNAAKMEVELSLARENAKYDAKEIGTTYVNNILATTNENEVNEIMNVVRDNVEKFIVNLTRTIDDIIELEQSKINEAVPSMGAKDFTRLQRLAENIKTNQLERFSKSLG